MGPTSRSFGGPPDRDARPDRSLGLALSPRMTAIFGGLFGLATITTIIALLIQSVPPRNDRTASSAAPASAPSTTASSEAAAPDRPSKKRIRVPLPGPARVAAMEKNPGTRVVTGSFERKSFLAALTEKGVPTAEVYRVIKAFESLRKFDKTAKTDKFIVALDKAQNRIIGFEYILSPYEVFQATEQNGLLVASKLDMQLTDAEVVGSVYVEKNLARALEEGGFEPSLAKEIDEALNGRMSTESFQEGATLRIIATETTALGEFARYKEIVAFEYRPPDPAQEPVRAYTFQGKRVRGYFDEKARQPDGSGWTIPVPGAPITSRFNPRRLHPVLKKIQPHNGTDFGAPTGTPIYAAYRGKISQFGPAGPCGNMVTVDHPGGIQTGYCHMSRFADGLKPGMTVGTKQLIGYVGTTGRSTGPHLHFWAKREGKFIDAETLRMNGFRVVPSDERDEFLARKAALDARLETIPLPDPPPRRVAPEPSQSARAPDAASSAAPIADGAAPKDPGVPSDPALADPGGPDPSMPPAAPGAVPFDDEGEDLRGPDLSPAGLKRAAASAKPPN